MSIEMTDATMGIWFCNIDRGDWMAAVDRTPEGGAVINYRFRHYVDDKVFDSDDVKNWYKVAAKDYKETMEVTKKLAQMISKTFGYKYHELLRGNLSTDDYAALLIHQEWAHTQTVAKWET